MTSATIAADKSRIYEEVARTTSYTGAKMDGDEKAYDRIFTTDEDAEMLDRFWQECQSALLQRLKKMRPYVHDSEGTFELELTLPGSFDTNLTASMQQSLHSYLVMGITAKWYAFTNRDDAAAYATDAAAHLEDILRKAYYRKPPERPTYA